MKLLCSIGLHRWLYGYRLSCPRTGVAAYVHRDCVRCGKQDEVSLTEDEWLEVASG